VHRGKVEKSESIKNGRAQTYRYGKERGESVASVVKKKKQATVGRICRILKCRYRQQAAVSVVGLPVQLRTSTVALFHAK